MRGVLISNSYVLTSAHCVYDIYKKGGTVTILIGVNTYSGLYKGHYIWYINHSPTDQNIYIPKEYIPIFSNGILDYDYDIALIRLNSQHAWKIPTASFPGPSAFPEKTNMGKQTTTIGIGSTSRYSYTLSKNLNEANVYIRDSNNIGVITLNSMDEPVKKSACWGDSGGPAIYYIANKIYVIGVAKSGYCYINSLYTSTSFNSKWITDTTGILLDSGDATMSQIVPTQQPLVNICYTRWDESECYRFNEFCRWDAAQKKCFPR